MTHLTRAGLLKRAIVLFWSLWISIVVVTNLGDVLKVSGALPSQWPLASGNFHAIVHATSRFGIPGWVDMLLFVAIIGWEALCALLFWTALREYRPGGTAHARTLYLSTSALFALFASFILADEIFHDYRMEGDHRGIAVLLLASVMVLRLLPDRTDAA